MFDTIMAIVTSIICIAWFCYTSIIIFIIIPEMKRKIKKIEENQLSIISHFDTELLRMNDSQQKPFL